MTDLKNALAEITTSHISPDDIEKSFEAIAVRLLRHTRIVTPNDHFYLREIEFYFYDPVHHPDPYAHKNKRQAEMGEWYFHRYTRIQSFMNSRRNGVDITFGNRAANRFGGILIRKIQSVETNELIAGINRSVKALIHQVGETYIDDIASGLGQQVFSPDARLHLEEAGCNSPCPVWKTQRYGLTPREDALSQKFFRIPYCYFNHELPVPEKTTVSPAI